MTSAFIDLTQSIEVRTSFLNNSTSINAVNQLADLAGVENIVGTAGSDQFFGDANNNTYFFNGFTTGFTEIFNGRGGTNTFDGSRSNISLRVNLTDTAMEVKSTNTIAPSFEAGATRRSPTF